MLIIKPAKTLTLFIKFWSKTTPKRGCFSASPTNPYLWEKKHLFSHSAETLWVALTEILQLYIKLMLRHGEKHSDNV
ncbi:MAG: hypothetical protein J6X11_08510, partial [Treponema sp.]|nr:hypothetical protein [Treponema sp.]